MFEAKSDPSRRRFSVSRRWRRSAIALLGAAALAHGGCGQTVDPGSVQFLIHTTPPPDDRLLSPLVDTRLSVIEVRDATTDEQLLRTRVDPLSSDTPVDGTKLDLGKVGVSEKRDLRLLALGAAGQQVLGVGLTRDAAWSFGEQKEIRFELRRPLFFFGGSSKLIPQRTPSTPSFAPTKQLFKPLLDETRLRVVDPNSVSPLLSSYDRQLDATQVSPGVFTAPPVSGAAGTFDGQSILVANLAGNLHLIDTLRMEDQASLPLNDDLPVQSIVIEPSDRSAVLLFYKKPTPAIGRVGKVLILRDLAGLRSRVSKDGNPAPLDIVATAGSSIGAPLSAAFDGKGMLDVVFGQPPLQVDQPDCALQVGSSVSQLRTYEVATGKQTSQIDLPYTTAVAYSAQGERVLVQPCSKAPLGTRNGRIVIQSTGGDKILPAPGVADIAVARGAILAVGRDDTADSPVSAIHGTVNILEGNSTTFATSQFDLPPWQIPFRVTTSGGQPYTSSVDMLFAPTDVMVYSIAVTPDRARALALMRVKHDVSGMFLATLTNSRCFIDLTGYTYHVLVINLQTGAREQDYMVGVQNQRCSSRALENGTNFNLGACFDPCNNADITVNPYLYNYQEGYVPSAASVLFGRR